MAQGDTWPEMSISVLFETGTTVSYGAARRQLRVTMKMTFDLWPAKQVYEILTGTISLLVSRDRADLNSRNREVVAASSHRKPERRLTPIYPYTAGIGLPLVRRLIPSPLYPSEDRLI
jgi:hypothetical protein